MVEMRISPDFPGFQPFYLYLFCEVSSSVSKTTSRAFADEDRWVSHETRKGEEASEEDLSDWTT